MKSQNKQPQNILKISIVSEQSQMEEIKMKPMFRHRQYQKLKRKFQKFLDRYQMMQVLYWNTYCPWFLYFCNKHYKSRLH